MSKLTDIIHLILFGWWYFLMIAIDRYILASYNPLVPFPRNVAELAPPKNKKEFSTTADQQHGTFNLLRLHNIVPKDAVCIESTVEGGAVTEPDKACARVTILYRTPSSGSSAATAASSSSSSTSSTKPEKLELFVKLPSVRQWSLVVKALIATTAPGQKEVNFYNHIVPFLEQKQFKKTGSRDLGFKYPKNVFSAWNRTFDRVILISETIPLSDYVSIPDWSPTQHVGRVSLMIDRIANLHAMTWKLRGLEPILPYLGSEATKGSMSWLDDVVQLYAYKIPSTSLILWNKIMKRLEREPVCLCHADNRAGNMLFSPDDKDVIHTDWEALSVIGSAGVWDVSYAATLTLSVADRKKYEKQLIQEYLSKMKKLGIDENDGLPTPECAWSLHRVCIIVITYEGFILAELGGVGSTHGNVSNDTDAWAERLHHAMLFALEDTKVLADFLEVDESLMQKFKDEYVAKKKLNASKVGKELSEKAAAAAEGEKKKEI